MGYSKFLVIALVAAFAVPSCSKTGGSSGSVSARKAEVIPPSNINIYAAQAKQSAKETADAAVTNINNTEL